MRSWPRAAVPELPGRGPLVRLHDTATGSRRVPATGTMYVCGITPYDATHLGHVATYLAFDVLSRVWRDGGLRVRYVQNVTDIDDPLLDRARDTGRDWAELAEEQTELFRTDMTWLRVLPPEQFVGAVESMRLIVELVGQLRSAGALYEVDGDLYFPVDAEPRFGEVSGLSRAQMGELFAERGGDPDRPGKKDPLDCLVWAKERPGDPAWDSPFGRGRPGWHVECAAMALAELGMGFDVQGGGSDLVFPHHEMSAAQAQVTTNAWPFARAYVHAGMIGLDGVKMAKSERNLVLAAQLRADGVDADAVRLALLADHYRADRDWTAALLSTAEERLARWRAAIQAAAGPEAMPVLTTMRARLADDLDTPGALAAVDEWASTVLETGGSDPGAPALIRDAVDALLGVELAGKAAYSSRRRR